MMLGASVPVGTVITFAGQVCNSAMPGAAVFPIDQNYPETDVEAMGWMVCDGRSLIPAMYPDLFATIGYLYGERNGYFVLPDARGYFLRGLDGGAGVDPQAAARKPAASGLAAGVGSTQACALQEHVHDYQTAPAPAAPSASGTAAGATSGSKTQTGTPVAAPGNTTPLGLSQQETRPVNLALYYLIKVHNYSSGAPGGPLPW
ncbi:MAG: hypothetical protein RLY71_3040 [Pseudomonadota bacterium]|jgi:hypothetical protein